MLNYTCECLPGFYGDFCEIDDRPCLPKRNRCKNNSTCTQHGFKYNCTCQSGFTGSHCEINIDDCYDSKCLNGGQCVDLINAYECNCISFFSGNFCEFKNTELIIKEQVSRSFSVLAITIIIATYGFFISLDVLRYVFHIEPDSLSQERQLIRKKRLVRKIIKDLKNKKKRRTYAEAMSSQLNGQSDSRLMHKHYDESFIRLFEKTFKISYDHDLAYIDDLVLNSSGRESKQALSELLINVYNENNQNK
jgi:hypothetical protein